MEIYFHIFILELHEHYFSLSNLSTDLEYGPPSDLLLLECLLSGLPNQTQFIPLPHSFFFIHRWMGSPTWNLSNKQSLEQALFYSWEWMIS